MSIVNQAQGTTDHIALSYVSCRIISSAYDNLTKPLWSLGSRLLCIGQEQCDSVSLSPTYVKVVQTLKAVFWGLVLAFVQVLLQQFFVVKFFLSLRF